MHYNAKFLRRASLFLVSLFSTIQFIFFTFFIALWWVCSAFLCQFYLLFPIVSLSPFHFLLPLSEATFVSFHPTGIGLCPVIPSILLRLTMGMPILPWVPCVFPHHQVVLTGFEGSIVRCPLLCMKTWCLPQPYLDYALVSIHASWGHVPWHARCMTSRFSSVLFRLQERGFKSPDSETLPGAWHYWGAELERWNTADVFQFGHWSGDSTCLKLGGASWRTCPRASAN